MGALAQVLNDSSNNECDCDLIVLGHRFFDLYFHVKSVGETTEKNYYSGIFKLIKFFVWLYFAKKIHRDAHVMWWVICVKFGDVLRLSIFNRISPFEYTSPAPTTRRVCFGSPDEQMRAIPIFFYYLPLFTEPNDSACENTELMRTPLNRLSMRHGPLGFRGKLFTCCQKISEFGRIITAKGPR